MKCAVCRARKGKRVCHLSEGRTVCPPCCASQRRSECEGCSFYEPSLSYQRAKELRARKFITELLPEVDDLCDDALALVEEGQIDDALARLKGLRRQHPRYHTILYGFGVCHLARGEWDEAIPFFEEAVAIYPPFAHAHYNLAAAYSRMFDLERAVNAYEMAVAIDGPDGPIGRSARERLTELEAITAKSGLSLSEHIRVGQVFDRAHAALKEGRFETAIGLFGQVLAANPRHVQSFGNLGLAYAALGKKAEALECLDRALGLDPDYELARVNRLIVERLEEGEALPTFEAKSVHYYRDFTLSDRSYAGELAKELAPELGPGSPPTRAGDRDS